MKTAKNYKFDDTTLAQIADIENWLPADSATSAIEEAIADFHRRLEMRREMGEFQAELADLWQRFEKHPHYDIYKHSDGSESMYNGKACAASQGRKGVYHTEVIARKDDLYKTAYSLYKLNELASSERWFVP